MATKIDLDKYFFIKLRNNEWVIGHSIFLKSDQLIRFMNSDVAFQTKYGIIRYSMLQVVAPAPIPLPTL